MGNESPDELLKAIQHYLSSLAASPNSTLIWMSIRSIKNPNIDHIPHELYSTFPKLRDLHISSEFIKFTATDAVNAKELKGLCVSDSNRIHKLTAGTFPVMKLKWLHLVQNEIDSIDDFTFANLTSLGELDLKNNRLTKIGRNTFARLFGLSRLVLDSNDIHTIEVGAFADLSRLKKISVRDNKLKVIVDDVFDGPNKLESLFLGSNEIENIENYLFTLNSLKELWLDDNRIEDIDLVKFAKLPKLKRLNLSKIDLMLRNHKISSEESYESPLEYLDLSYNDINSATGLKLLRIFPHLKALNLIGNKELELDDDDLERLRTFLPDLHNVTLH